MHPGYWRRHAPRGFTLTCPEKKSAPGVRSAEGPLAGHTDEGNQDARDGWDQLDRLVERVGAGWHGLGLLQSADRPHRACMLRRDPIHEKLTSSAIGAFYDVYNTLGFGFLEHVYVLALERELLARGHRVARELGVTIIYKGDALAVQRLDMVVD